jgi:hypothetical protein
MAVRLSALRAGPALSPGRFLVLISVRGRIDSQAVVGMERLRQLKKSNCLIKNRTRALRDCSRVSQPTTLPRALISCNACIILCIGLVTDRLGGLMVIVLDYRSGGPGSIPGTTRKKSSGSGTGSTQPREYN